jgi:hypothetical protein
MESGLLERDTELAALDAAVASAERGAGSVVLVAGYAGPGQDQRRAGVPAHGVRSGAGAGGACDDLLTPRVLDPSRAAARATGGALADAAAGGDRDAGAHRGAGCPLGAG